MCIRDREEAVRKTPVKKVRCAAVRPDFDGDVTGFSERQRLLLSTLATVGETEPASLCSFCGVTEAVLRALVKKGAVLMYKKEAEVLPEPENVSKTEPIPVILSDEQELSLIHISYYLFFTVRILSVY